MVWKRKKQKPVEELLPEQEEQEEGTEEGYAEKIKELDTKIAALGKKADKAITKEPETKGEFSLDGNEMALAVNALASSEEFKLYQQMVIGQQIAGIIAEYNKVVGGKKDEIPSSEDTEEELPEPN